MFASMFPDDVTGVLLLDASPATWITTLCSVVDDGSDGAASYRELCASLSDPANNPEHLDGPSAFAEVAEVTSLGDLPMIVDTAAEHPWGLAPSENAASTRSGPLAKTTGCPCPQRHSSCQWTTQDITSRSIDPTLSTYRSLRCWPAAPTAPNPRGRARRSRRRPDPEPARRKDVDRPGAATRRPSPADGDVILYASLSPPRRPRPSRSTIHRPLRNPSGRHSVEVLVRPPSLESRSASGRAAKNRRGSEESAAIHSTSPSNSALGSALSQLRGHGTDFAGHARHRDTAPVEELEPRPHPRYD